MPRLITLPLTTLLAMELPVGLPAGLITLLPAAPATPYTAPPAGIQGGLDPTPTRTSAADGAFRPDEFQAFTSTPSPFSRAERPTNRNLTVASVGHEGV